MNKIRIPITPAILTVLILVLTVESVGAFQLNAPAGPPLNYRLDRFELKDETFVAAVSKLSLLPIEGFHLGVEEVLREKTMEPAPLAPQFSMLIEHGTVGEVLDTLCSHDRRYAWSQDGLTINIYPVATADDHSYLLNRHLERIEVKDIPDPGQSLAFLYRQLPPPREQLGEASGGGDPSYQSPWTQTFEDLTIRQLMNRLSEHMGTHTSWVFFGSKQERYFFFAKGGFH